MKKRGKSFELLKQVISQLANDGSLEPKFRDHKLLGDYSGIRECHLEPDWLLIYMTTPDELTLVRTGSHADLFK